MTITSITEGRSRVQPMCHADLQIELIYLSFLV